MKAIVTGANGFIGSAVVKKLVDAGMEVLAIDLSFSPSRMADLDGVKKLELSIENISEIKSMCRFGEYDIFFHFAWVGSSGALRNDLEIQTKNALWTADCLKTASTVGCKRFVCAGSIMEYEIIDNIYNKINDIELSNLYSSAKQYSHAIAKPIANSLGIDLIWAYITNAYGAGELSPRFINSTIRKIILDDDLVFTAGTQNYDFVYIDDVANAFYLIGIHGKKNKSYLIGSGGPKPLKEFIIELCTALQYKKKPVFGSVSYNGANLCLETFSINDLVEDCGYKPSIPFKEGVIKTRDWLIKNI